MRGFWDRVRHAVMFEVVGLILFVPCAMWLFSQSLQHMGVIGVFSSIMATIWNFFYNLGFDKMMMIYRGSTHKTFTIRIFHTILFEAGLLFVTLPSIAWYLSISFVQALTMDLTIVVYYLIFAFFFNIAYDYIFPIKDEAKLAA